MSHDQSKDAAVGGSDRAPTFKKPGDLLARQYEVVDLLGEGGASVVYRCKHAVLGTDCAVKVLLPDRIPDQKVLQRFQLEAKSIGRLEHRHIVAVHEFGIDDENQPFLVMDFVDGKNLAQIIEEESFLTPRRALALFIQIAEALAHAHSRAIIHRDLKPKNVIVEGTGQKNECAKLVDFGIAKITEAENENKPLTQTGEIFGSPLFMSPEQCKGWPVDHRSDIYSFGCLMYEVITGIPAAQAESVLESLMLHVNGLQLEFDNTPPAVALKEKSHKKSSSEFAEFKCFNGLRKIIETCTAREPEKRYKSAEELLKALKRLSTGRTAPDFRLFHLGVHKQGRLSNTKSGKIPTGIVLVLLNIAIFSVSVTMNHMEKNAAKPSTPTEIDTKFADVLKNLKSSKDVQHRLPVLLFHTVLPDGQLILSGGPHGAFNTSGCDNMIALNSKPNHTELRKMEHLGCTDYIFRGRMVTDEQLSALAKLKKIDWLAMPDSTGFSPAGLPSFKDSSLKKLHLSYAPITDYWAPTLESLPLSTLSLDGTKITRRGVEKVVESRTLKYLLLDQNLQDEMSSELKKRNWRLLPDESREKNWFVRQ